MAFTRVGGIWAHEYVCLSTDTKYTRASHPDINVPNGSSCLEINPTTNEILIYIYDKDNDQWRPISLD